MTAEEPLRSLVATALPRCWSYLKTWQREDGQVSGLIATWWSSSVETAEPHPMNQFPLIIGLTRLARSNLTGADWLGEARRIADGLIASISADGALSNDYADIPPRTASPIFYSACVRSLCELSIATGDERYLRGARRLDEFLTQRWTRGDELAGCPVSNQELSWAWSKLWLGRASGQTGLIQQAARIARRTLAHQIRSGPMAGAVCQGRFDDRLISVYVAKCIEPLWEIGGEVGDDELLAAAKLAAEYMLRQGQAPGIWLNYHGPGGPAYQIARQVTRLDRRLFRQRFPLYALRRPFIRWESTPYPSWIARSGDGIRALWSVGEAAPRFREHAGRLARGLLEGQYPHGGFANTVGFFGDPQRRDWQDVAPCARWNAYVFLLLCRLAIDLGIRSVAPAESTAEWSCELSAERTLRESAAQIELLERGATCWRIQKATGRPEVVAAEWRGDLSGHRGRPQGRNA